MFRPVKAYSLTNGVVDQITGQIESGRLKPGDRIPGERVLAEKLQVSRAVVREAMRRLQALGLVEIHPGRGIFVGHGVSDELALFPWLASQKADALMLLEVRDALETRAAQLAAENASDEDLERLEENVKRQFLAIEEHPEDLSVILLLDEEFHRLVAQASSNPFLVDLNERINQLLNTRLLGRERREGLFRIPGRLHMSAEEHRRVTAAIAAGKAEEAVQAMTGHLRSVMSTVARLPRSSETAPTTEER